MKRVLTAMILALVPLVASAAYFEPIARIHALKTSDPDLWGFDVDYLLLEGLYNAGNCAKESDSGMVVVVLPREPRAFAMAMGAKLAGHRIQVSLDDTRRDANGFCVMRWMALASP